MNRSVLKSMIRHVEALALGSGVDAPGDDELLARFLKDRDESAFSAILNRHGRLVWAVCRGVLSHDADAEDAFQATFLALFRGAKQIREVKSLAPWLHGTATKIAKKARLTAGRRNGREKRVAKQEAASSHVPEATWDATFQAVHDEIARLPATLRGAFVLCVLEGERHQDAAVKLGVPIGTLSARVSRARQKLLDRLTSRGLAPGLAAAALALGSNTGPAAIPEAVLASLRISVMNGFSTISTSITTLAITATEGTTMKVKLLAAAVMIGTAMTISTGGSLLNRADGQVSKPAPASTAPATPAAAPPASTPKPTPPLPPAANSVPATPSVAPTPTAPASNPPSSTVPPSPTLTPTPIAPTAELPLPTPVEDMPIPAPRAWANPSPAPTPARPSAQRITYFTIERPNTVEAFRTLLGKKAEEGWVYIGSETFLKGPEQKPYVLAIFRSEPVSTAKTPRFANNNPNTSGYYEPVVNENGQYGYALRPSPVPTYNADAAMIPPTSSAPPLAHSVDLPTPSTTQIYPAPVAEPGVTNPKKSFVPESVPNNVPPRVSNADPSALERVPTPETTERRTVAPQFNGDPLIPTANKTASNQALLEMYNNALRETKFIPLNKDGINHQTFFQVVADYLNKTEPEMSARVKMEMNEKNGVGLKIVAPKKDIVKVEELIRKLEKDILDLQKSEAKRP